MSYKMGVDVLHGSVLGYFIMIQLFPTTKINHVCYWLGHSNIHTELYTFDVYTPRPSVLNVFL